MKNLRDQIIEQIENLQIEITIEDNPRKPFDIEATIKAVKTKIIEKISQGE
jgi:hypothetical protein